MRKPIPRQDLFRQLIEESELPSKVGAFYQLPKGPLEAAPPYSVRDAFALEERDLSDVAVATLNALESLDEDDPVYVDWLDFRWKLSALIHLQDIFDAPFHRGRDLRTMFQQYYFYYEGLIILAECVLAGLNGLYVASDALLRPFLEFSLFQNYYYRLTFETGSYATIEDYFAGKYCPSWNTAMGKALPKDAFCRPIRFRLSAHRKALSESTQHVYHPESSVMQHRKRQHGHSIEGVFFWQKIGLILDSVLWLYYANFPLLFHPVDVLRKFGFNGPVGVLADPLTGYYVRKSLTPTDYEAFRTYSEEHALDTIAWARSREDLTDAEIVATWLPEEDGPLPPELSMAYAMKMVRLRALRFGLSFRAASNQEKLPAKFMDDIRTLKGWANLARRRQL